MPLHLPKNRDAGSFSKTWQNNFWQTVLALQRTYDSLRDNFVGTENDINSKRAFLDKAREWFDLVAGTAVSITRKLGQRVVNVVPEDTQIIQAGQVFDPRLKQADRIVAGSNITLTRKLGAVTIAATSGGALTVKTLDGTVSDTAVTVIQQQNNALLDNGAGDVTLGWMEPLVDTSVPEILFDGTTGDILMTGVTT